jgi:hypothetical protein
MRTIDATTHERVKKAFSNCNSFALLYIPMTFTGRGGPPSAMLAPCTHASHSGGRRQAASETVR